MNLRIPAIHPSIAAAALLSVITLGAGSNAPVQAFSVDFAGQSSGSWTLPANATGSTALFGQNGANNNTLQWGLTKTQVPACTSCTDFNNYVQFTGSTFAPDVNGVLFLGYVSYLNASTTDLVDGVYKTVDFGVLPLKVSLLFNQPGLSPVDFNFNFSIRNTTNVPGDPVASADILSFGSTGRISQSFVVGGQGYTLNLLGFGEPLGALAGQFSVPEAVSSDQLFSFPLFAKLLEDTNDSGGVAQGGVGGVCH